MSRHQTTTTTEISINDRTSSPTPPTDGRIGGRAGRRRHLQQFPPTLVTTVPQRPQRPQCRCRWNEHHLESAPSAHTPICSSALSRLNTVLRSDDELMRSRRAAHRTQGVRCAAHGGKITVTVHLAISPSRTGHLSRCAACPSARLAILVACPPARQTTDPPTYRRTYRSAGPVRRALAVGRGPPVHPTAARPVPRSPLPALRFPLLVNTRTWSSDSEQHTTPQPNPTPPKGEAYWPLAAYVGEQTTRASRRNLPTQRHVGRGRDLRRG